MKLPRCGFTLLELLISMSIIAILAVMVTRMAPGILGRAKEVQSLNNLRQVGLAFRLYANDHDANLPQRVTTSEKWPVLLQEYLKTPKVYADPGDPKNYLTTGADPFSNARNQTSYIMNGYNDLGAYSDETVVVKLPAINGQTRVILAAIQFGTGNFYMDFVEGNQTSVLNKTAYRNGSNYLFTDGSARFLKLEEYDDRLWLVNSDYTIPPL